MLPCTFHPWQTGDNIIEIMFILITMTITWNSSFLWQTDTLPLYIIDNQKWSSKSQGGRWLWWHNNRSSGDYHEEYDNFDHHGSFRGYGDYDDDDHSQIGDSGVIRSPNYPSAYPADIKCVWWLKAKSKGSYHTFTISHFHSLTLSHVYLFHAFWRKRVPI